MRSYWVSSLLALAAAGVLAAPPADVEGPLGLVRVSGGGYREARDIGRRMEDVFHRLENLSGNRIDQSKKPYVRLVIPAQPWGVPSLDVAVSSNGLPWTITVTGPLADQTEDLYTILCRLALSLWTENGGHPLDRGDWLAAGLAGSLFPQDRARHRAKLQELVEDGRLPELATIVTWNRMPSGDMPEKAAAAQAVAWMTAGPGGGELPAFLEQLSKGRIRGSWLLAQLSARHPDPEAAWREEAGRGDILAGGVRPLSPRLFARFRKALLTPPAAVGLEGGEAMPALSPHQLLAVRGAKGVREAAKARALDVQRLAVGTPPELSAAALDYKAFFDGLAGRTPAYFLRRRLASADAALRRVEDEAVLRGEWVDRFDDEAGPDPTVSAGKEQG